MDTSGQAAETMVKYSLEGMEYTLKIAGAGATRLAAILMAAARDQQKAHHQTNPYHSMQFSSAIHFHICTVNPNRFAALHLP